MKIVEEIGTITHETYFAVSVEIAGIDCIFRMPECQYSELKVELSGDTGAIKKAVASAFQKTELER